MQVVLQFSSHFPLHSSYYTHGPLLVCISVSQSQCYSFLTNLNYICSLIDVILGFRTTTKACIQNIILPSFIWSLIAFYWLSAALVYSSKWLWKYELEEHVKEKKFKSYLYYLKEALGGHLSSLFLSSAPHIHDSLRRHVGSDNQ